MAGFFDGNVTSGSFFSGMPKEIFSSVGPIKLDTAFKPASTGTSTGTSMEPITAALGLGSSLIGSVGSALAGNAAADAAEQAAKQRTKEELSKQFAGFGLDYLTQRYNTGAGAAANRMNTLKETTDTAAFQAFNPAMQNLRSNERFGNVQEYAARLSAAMPGYVSPLNIFS